MKIFAAFAVFLLVVQICAGHNPPADMAAVIQHITDFLARVR